MEQKAKGLLILLQLFLCLIHNQLFSFDNPRWVCLDPGHGGKWPGTMGWNDNGPAEKEHNLSACQVLDEILFQSYEGEWPFQTYNYFVVHTRIDDIELDESLGTDLHLRAEIANGNVNGYYNQNFDFRFDFPPAYDDPWWVEKSQRADFFLSYHHNYNDDYSIQRTDCYYYYGEYDPDDKFLRSVLPDDLI